MDINIIFDKLYEFYNVNSISDLSVKMNISQPAVSRWRSRNSINAIKRKCRELGIYNEIFGDIQYIQNIDNNSGINANINNGIQQQNGDNGDTSNNTLIPEDILSDLNTLFKLAKDKNKSSFLIDEIDDFIYRQKKSIKKS